MEAFLKILIEKEFPEITYHFIKFRGKSDLLKSLGKRLKGYAKSMQEYERIFVLVDRDRDDCYELKTTLEHFAIDAGLKTKSSSPENYQIVNIIVIDMLEAWYFGHWDAVCKAYPKMKHETIKQKNFRKPDEVKGHTKYQLQKLFQQRVLYKTGLLQLQIATNIAECYDPSSCISPSFQQFWRALKRTIELG